MARRRAPLPSTPLLVAEEIKTQLGTVGVNVTIVELESQDFVEAAVNSGDLTMFLLGWSVDWPDADNSYNAHLGADSFASFGTPYADIQGLIGEARSTVAIGACGWRCTADIAGLVNDHVPLIPVAHGIDAGAFLSDVTGAHLGWFTEQFAVIDPGGPARCDGSRTRNPSACTAPTSRTPTRSASAPRSTKTLVALEPGGTTPRPGLATAWTSNPDGTLWTSPLRRRQIRRPHAARRQRRSPLLGGAMGRLHPLHIGRTGDFWWFTYYFGEFLNAGQ